MTKSVYENDMFNVTIEKPTMSLDVAESVMVYAVTNKETGVRETETTALIRAKMEADAFMVQLQDYQGPTQFRESPIEQVPNMPYLVN